MEAQTVAEAGYEMKDVFQSANCETDEFFQSLYKGKELARMYATHRPQYPQKIFDEIMSYHREVLTNGHQLAVDVCCGTGLSTLPLVPLFEKVVGVDVSEDLMEYLPRDVPNLTAHVCPAENMTMIDSGTADLVTIAMGLPWVNIEKFFQEAKRILKPCGTFAAYSWHTGRLEPEAANQAYKEFMMKFKDFMTSKAILMYEKYQSIDLPFQDLRRYEMEVLHETTIEKFRGFLSSVHFMPLYNKVHPGNNELDALGNSLEAISNHDGDDRQPVSVKMYNTGDDRQPISVKMYNTGDNRQPISVKMDNTGDDRQPISVKMDNTGDDRQPISVKMYNTGDDRQPISVKMDNTGDDRQPISVKMDNTGDDRQPISVKMYNTVFLVMGRNC